MVPGIITALGFVKNDTISQAETSILHSRHFHTTGFSRTFTSTANKSTDKVQITSQRSKGHLLSHSDRCRTSTNLACLSSGSWRGSFFNA